MNDNDTTATADKPRSRLDQLLRKIFRWLLTLRGSPESIALGVAIGLFTACSPLLGLHMAIAIVLATLLGANRPAALGASLANNPATFVPLYALEYWVGSWFWPGPPVAKVKQVLSDLADQVTGAGIFQIKDNLTAIFELGWDVFIPMLIGGTLIGFLVGTAAYFPTVAMVRKLRALRREKRGKPDQATKR